MLYNVKQTRQQSYTPHISAAIKKSTCIFFVVVAVVVVVVVVVVAGSCNTTDMGEKKQCFVSSDDVEAHRPLFRTRLLPAPLHDGTSSGTGRRILLRGHHIR
jgi:hypothetical protein